MALKHNFKSWWRHGGVKPLCSQWARVDHDKLSNKPKQHNCIWNVQVYTPCSSVTMSLTIVNNLNKRIRKKKWEVAEQDWVRRRSCLALNYVLIIHSYGCVFIYFSILESVHSDYRLQHYATLIDFRQYSIIVFINPYIGVVSVTCIHVCSTFCYIYVDWILFVMYSVSVLCENHMRVTCLDFEFTCIWSAMHSGERSETTVPLLFW